MLTGPLPLVRRLLQDSDNVPLPSQRRCCDVGCSPVICFCRGGVEDAGGAGAPRPYTTWVAIGARHDQVARQRMTLPATGPRPRSSPPSPPGATSL